MLSYLKPKIILNIKNILLITLFYDAVLSFVRTFNSIYTTGIVYPKLRVYGLNYEYENVNLY
jgi:hypothetical protein